MSSSADVPLDRAHLKILLVEDNLINQRVLLKQLSHVGYRVDAVADGQAAIAAIAQGYDIILMDCQLPILDGYEVTRRVRQLNCASVSFPQHPVIIIALTANSMIEAYDKAIAAGMNDYLSKPIPKAVLEATLDHWGDRLRQSTALSAPGEPRLPLSGSRHQHAISEPIDQSFLSRMTDGNSAFELELLKIFVQDHQGRLERLRRAIAQGNVQQIEHLAHSIRGASASVGARHIQAIAENLEQEARQHDLDQGDRLLTDMEQALTEIQGWIRERSGELDASGAS